MPAPHHRREWDRHDDAWPRGGHDVVGPARRHRRLLLAPTSPPDTTKRDGTDRLRLMHEMFVGREAWVLSGTLMGWGDSDPDFDGRNRARHQAWLGTLPCTVLRLDSARPVDELVKEIIEFSPPGAHVTS